MMRLAVVLFNLGGPDGPEAVRPFLFNLFNDPAIIRLPGPLRWLIAHMIVQRRYLLARQIYARIGGASPLLDQTLQQANALEQALGGERRVFVAMRYWHPFCEETVAEVALWKPDRVVLLPLYPQYSTTTTASSLAAWTRAASRIGLTASTCTVCCYPTLPGMIAAQAEQVGKALDQAGPAARVLFSAHGLPQRIVDSGDPYPEHVALTTRAILAALGRDDLDWVICYQSRVGPLAWIGPSTDDEIRRGGRDARKLIVVPIAFVSEHSETLVELDMDYARLAREAGVPAYIRVPTLGTHPAFIAGLADLAWRAAADNRTLCCDRGTRLCSAEAKACAQRGAA